jgi:hypothetical protein
MSLEGSLHTHRPNAQDQVTRCPAVTEERGQPVGVEPTRVWMEPLVVFLPAFLNGVTIQD